MNITQIRRRISQRFGLWFGVWQLAVWLNKKMGFHSVSNSPLFGDDSVEFTTMMNSIRHRTLVTQDKCFLLDRCLRHSLRVTTGATAVAECGVFKGGTAFLLASILKSENPELTLHLFDTFKGIPESSDCDMTAVGDLANTSLESVQDFLRPFPVVVFHPGFIPNTFAGLREQRYCFVHVDVDNYRSTLSCCEYFYPRLLPGGMLICDDYLLPGAKKAVNDFFATKPEVPIPMRSGQCLIVRGNQP